MAIHSRHIRGNLAYWDTHRKRLVDAVGPDVFKVIDDFTYTDAASDALPGWTTTLVEAGGGESTVTVTNESGGALLLTTDAFEADSVNIHLDSEFVELTSDQDVYFGIRLKINDVDQTDLFAGLFITDTEIQGGVSDGVYFESLDESASLSVVTEKNSTETQTNSVGTLVDDTYVILEWYFDGTAVEFFVDGASVARHTANIPDDELLTIAIEFETGEAAAQTCTIDWIRAIVIGR